MKKRPIFVANRSFRMKYITIIISLLGLSWSAIAQNIKGHILDSKSSEPLTGVNVYYKDKGGTRGTVSDINGYYELRVTDGEASITFSYLGYETTTLTVHVAPGQFLTQDVRLEPRATMMDEVVVSVGRHEQKLSEVTVSMDLLKADEITRQAPKDLTDVLKNISGVEVTDRQPSIRGGTGWTYGVGSRCLILVYGMSVLTPASGEINWNMIPMENIDQVEVLKGASSVLYGSSALNGLIHIRTKRPSLEPHTRVNLQGGLYGSPSPVSAPLYGGLDLSHTRQIKNLDLSLAGNTFIDNGYRIDNYNRRVRLGGNLTYRDPNIQGLNYGANLNYLYNDYTGFFIWRSPGEAYRPSPFTNMGRESNNFRIDPFFNFTNPERGTSHKVKGRFYYSADNVVRPTQSASITDILGNMGTDAQVIQNIANGDYTALQPLMTGVIKWLGSDKLSDLMDGVFGSLDNIFPNATTADYCDLISWVMSNGLPSDMGGLLEGKLPSDLVPWLSGVLNPKRNQSPTRTDKNYDYYLDYQFNKKWDGGAQITTGLTYEHIRTFSGETEEVHQSDNVAAYMQYDQRFWDRLSVSAGVRAEYYRIDKHYREADTKVFGSKIPFRPVFRAGLNYQLADYSFLRASFGQGYRNPSITEKYLRKDIGGVGVYPNYNVQPEKGFNAELGFKQGYKAGNLQGFADVAAFYTQYKDMVEFQFGLFNNADLSMINSVTDAIQMLKNGKGFGIGAQFHNVSKAQIYGMEISTNGMYTFNKNAKLLYNLGYVYTEPRDADYKKRNALENTYTDPLQMKEKSNMGKYLKYRPKHSFKTTVDFQWKRINVGANVAWKSKILAVDYLMLDERSKTQNDLMDYVRGILFGYSKGETLATYWKKHNTDYATVDFRFGVKATKEVAFQFMVNNLFNKEYSYRPMAVAAPRTFVLKMDVTF